MNRLLALTFVAGLAIFAARFSGADEPNSVNHTEPITVRILSGRDGQPIATFILFWLPATTSASFAIIFGRRRRLPTRTVRRGSPSNSPTFPGSGSGPVKSIFARQIPARPAIAWN